MTAEYTAAIQQLFEIQTEILGLHPLLEQLYPIAIVEGEKFLIYDLDPAGAAYQFIKAAPLPIPVPDKVRAAFDLQAYDNRIACVVTGDIFDEPDGYVTIFHEFIHCGQASMGEMEIKQGLSVCQQAMAVQDNMWEINYPFPYNDPEFAAAYQTIITTDSLEEIDQIHKQLKARLGLLDYEYLVWQEWKEGLARYIENLIRQQLGFTIRKRDENKPLNRVAFYEGGANYIQLLSKFSAEPSINIIKLFYRMLEGK